MAQWRRTGFVGRIKSRAGQTLVEYLLATLMLTVAMAGAYGALGNGVKGAFHNVLNIITSEMK